MILHTFSINFEVSVTNIFKQKSLKWKWNWHCKAMSTIIITVSFRTENHLIAFDSCKMSYDIDNTYSALQMNLG